MKLGLVRSGGVAGLRKAPLVVDTAALPAADRDRLRTLVDAAQLPAQTPAQDLSPDQIGYQLSVTDDTGATQTLDVSLASASPALRALITEIRRLTGAR
jgi:hypothetical protein